MLVIQIFLYLQVLDFMTTILGFRVGAAEASPFIAKMMHVSSPMMGVAASKLLAIGLAGVCLMTQRQKLVSLINYWYAGLVVWNLVVIFIAVNRNVHA